MFTNPILYVYLCMFVTMYVIDSSNKYVETNVYFKLLAKKSKNSVHVVDSSWFSDVLIKSKDTQKLQWYLNREEKN